MNKTEKNYSIEFLRFIFSIFIVYFHILHSNIMPFVNGNEIYSLLQKKSSWACWIVECFLIIGGYFLYKSTLKNKSTFVLFTDRIVRLWPVFAFHIFIYFFFFKLNLQEALFQLCFLHCTGISLSFKGIIWYISPYFWASLLIISILRTFSIKPSLLILAVTCYWGYLIEINHCHGGLGREVVWECISFGFYRVYSGLALGVLLSYFLEKIEKCFKSSNINRIYSLWVWTIVELIMLGILLKLFIFGKGVFSNVFIVIIFFALLFASFIQEKGYLSHIFNKKIFGYCGRYAYSIYVMQQISFNILAKCFWKNSRFLTEYPYLTMIFSVLFSVLVGVITYYLIEKPVFSFYQQYKHRHFIV